ncbi:MAG: hypothetical protein E2O86_06155 [Bacteroidetes bacterium]|nr:MAG: hypothetical protein E2O86_06155 [Bacteroidota bacterium]
MKDSLDKLFREKLQSLESTPSSDAWNQILGELEPKKSRVTWYYAAAAVAAVISVSILLVSQQDSAPLVTIATEINEPSVQESINNQEATHINEIMANTSFRSSPELKTIKNTENTKPGMVTEIESESLLLPDPIFSMQAVGANVDNQFTPMQLDFYPMYVDNVIADESKFKKAFQYAQRVKNGEENLFNLRKAKEDLFAFAKSKIKSEENSQVNFD